MKRVFLTAPPPPIQKPPELMVDVSAADERPGQVTSRRFVTLTYRHNGDAQQSYRIEAKAAIALAKAILDEARGGRR
jgi:hypothetical protein